MATDLIPLGDASLRQKARLSLSVNGEERELLVDSYKTLLEVLREDLGLTGTKHGCELGECGACAVLVDGQPVLSCLVARASSARAARVETVEGMADGPRAAPAAGGFADLGAAQCGYCTPGFLLTAKALLERRTRRRRATRSPRRSRASSAAAPATCRSSRRSRQRRRAAARPRPTMSDGVQATRNVIGKPLRARRRARQGDRRRPASPTTSSLPRHAALKLLRSTHAARAHRRRSTPRGRPRCPGVQAGAHRRATSRSRSASCRCRQDEHALCTDKVRFVGDPVAAVIAVDELTADEALELIDVDYEPLATIADRRGGAATPEPRIHDYGDDGNVHKSVALRLRRRRRGARRGRPGVRGRLLLRGQHAPAHRAARHARLRSTPTAS